MSDISRSQRKRENVMRGRPMMEGIESRSHSETPRTPSDSRVEEALNDEFWSFCEDNAINGAMRIDENWRVDDVAVKFASHIRTQEREKSDAQCDRHWIAGAQFGWNCGTHKELNDAIDARRRDIAAAIREPK